MDWITPVELQPGSGMIPAEYHLVTAAYHLVWRLEERFASVRV